MTDALAGKAANPKSILTGSSPEADNTEGMSYLQSLPRRLVTVYLPLSLILLVLLFPFYWMALTSVKPDEQLLDLDTYSPFWTWTPTLKHINKLLFDTEKNNKRIRLTDKETAILKFLFRAGNKPVARETLLGEVWGYNAGVATHTLETHVYRLRQKIERDPANVRILVTDAGGYRLNAEG